MRRIALISSKRIPQMSGEESAPWPPQVAAPPSAAAAEDAAGWSVSLLSPVAAADINMFTPYGPYFGPAGHQDPLSMYQQCYPDYEAPVAAATDYSQQQSAWAFNQQLNQGMQRHQHQQDQYHQRQLEPLYKSLSHQLSNSSGEFSDNNSVNYHNNLNQNWARDSILLIVLYYFLFVYLYLFLQL